MAETAASPPAATSTDRGPAPGRRQLTLRFGGVTALDDVSFDIREGEILGPDRAQRRRQDHLLQRDDRRLPAHRRRVRFDGQSARQAQAVPDHPARHRPDVPEHPAVHQTMTALENVMVGRRRAQHRPGCHRRAVPHAPACAGRRRRRERAARELLRLRRASAQRSRGAGAQPVLRRPAPARDRPGAGDRAQAALPRRAGRRLQPRREGAADGPDPQGPRRGLHRAAHRARHEPGHGRHRPDRGAGVRPQDRRGRAGRDPRQPGGHRGLPGSATEDTMLLEVEGLCVNYGRIEAIRDITFTVEEGEIVTLIGANGAGKTTTMKTHLRAAQGARRRRSASRARTSPTCRRTSGSSWASASRPRAGGIFPGMTVRGEPRHGRLRPQGPARPGVPGGPGAGLRRCSRGCTSAATSRPARCPAASSRCSPSGGR